MRLQIWQIEDIENVLLATQTVMQAIAAVSTKDGRPEAYYLGFKAGFEAALKQIMTSFNTSATHPVWSREDIENVLWAAQAVMQAIAVVTEEQAGLLNQSQGFEHGRDVALWCSAVPFDLNLPSLKQNPLSTRVAAGSYISWFYEDIRNILLALQWVMRNIALASEGMTRPLDYNEGFETALGCVAQSFGIKLFLPANTPAPERTAPSFWLRRDIEYKLLVVYQTMLATRTAPDGNARSLAYRQGFESALYCVAGAFGVRLG